MNNRDRLIDCLAAVFPSLDREQIPFVTVASVKDWDSLTFVNIIALVQEEYGVDITPDDFDEISSFDLILDAVAKKSKVTQGGGLVHGPARQS